MAAATALSSTTSTTSAEAEIEEAASGRDYRALLSMLLPRGKAWNRALTSTLQLLLSGAAMTFDRIQTRSNDLLLEMDPRTARETIADWERITQPYGTQDEPTDLDERRAAVTAVIVGRGGWSGGPSVPFLQAIAAALGYPNLTIRRFHRRPFTCVSKCTDNLNTASAGWIFVWEFIAVSRGEALDALLQEQLLRYAGAHLSCTFAFPLLGFDDATFVRASTAVITDPSSDTATALASGELGTLYHGA